MTLEIPVGHMQVAYRFLLAGDSEPMVTTMGYRLDDTPSLQNQVDQLRDNFVTAWPVAQRNTQWTFLGCVARVGQDGGPPVIVESPASSVGTNSTGTTLPNNISLLVKKQTGIGGRAHRGRCFVPPFNLVGVDVDQRGYLQSGWLSAHTSRITGWLGYGITGTLRPRPVILHDDGIATPSTPTLLTAVVLDARVATQRRRLRP